MALGVGANIAREKERTLRAAWLISLTAPLATAAAFLLGRSAVQLADFIRRTSELLALFLAWLTLRKVSAGETAEYNYGYARLESLSSLLISVVMFISFGLITYSSLLRFLDPVPLGWVAPGLVVPAGGMVVNGWFWRRGSLLARSESTPVIEAQWRLCRSKTILDVCVLVTLVVAVILGDGPWTRRTDLAGSLAIGVFLLVSSWRIGRSAVEDLLDRAVPGPLRRRMEETVQRIGSTRDFHLVRLRSRRLGGRAYVELHLAFHPEFTAEQICNLADEISRSTAEDLPGAKVLVVPVRTATRSIDPR